MVLLSLGRIIKNKKNNKLVPLRKCLYISIIYQPFLLKFGMIILLGERIMSRDITATLQYCSIPCSAAEFIISLYVSHFSSYWVEIRHDPFVRGKDHVERKNSDPAALQYFMQCCRISEYFTAYISQPFLNWLADILHDYSLGGKNQV